MTDQPDKAAIQPGQPVLFIDERDREKLVVCPEDPEEKVNIGGEQLTGAQVMALHDGELLVTRRRRRFLVFRPTLNEVVMNMPRQAQVIYPKDLGVLLMYADIAPGQRVAEVGAGHGAMTMALLRLLGPAGRLTTYDIRQDHLNRTRKNIAAYVGDEAVERWRPVMADPGVEGLGLAEGEPAFDRLITDVPEPWSLADAAVEALRPGGLWAAWVPTVLQMMNLVEAVKAHRDLCLPAAFETLQRYWHIARPACARPTT